MKLKALFLLLLSLSLSVNISVAQKKNKRITVSGYVTDVDKKPVAGTLIMVDKKISNSRTDDEGYYKVRIRSDAVMISVITEDNRRKSELIDGRTSINFSLQKPDSSQVSRQSQVEEKDMIDLGYKTMDSKKISTPAKRLDVTKNDNSIYSNIYEMIKGKVPGVVVNGETIRIRGSNSFLENNDPLFVVDGMPVISISNILPIMVESVSVLSGAAATMYGSRGVNGVIVITLKRQNVQKNYK